MNDARFISIGVDPETGEELYADISNTCSRGYAQFGEKLMTISAENMAEVKRIMARYHRIELTSNDQSSDIWKKRFDDLSRKLKTSMTEASVNGVKVVELTEANDDLKAKLKAAYLECDEKKQACEEAQKTAKDALDHISELEAENKKLWDDKKSLEISIAQQDPINSANTDVDALLWKISLLEQELKDKDEFISVLKQITFKSLAKGGE
jgi:chromosome segregation ATPase